jgi:hypothetical protein
MQDAAHTLWELPLFINSSNKLYGSLRLTAVWETVLLKNLFVDVKLILNK